MAQSAASDHAGFAARIVGVADKLRPNRKPVDAEPAVEEMLRHYPDGDAELVRRAYAYAAEAHEGQRRVSGGPYVEHPYHWGYVDTWFDPESPHRVVEPGVAHVYCPASASVLAWSMPDGSASLRALSPRRS